jgi:predicted TIM-barrel fold metal-dependent hydrolase
MQIFKTGTLAAPAGVPSTAPLTIDVHCHIFNGTDLQIEEFLGDVVFPTWWGKAAGEILRVVNWSLAPQGVDEKAKLESLLQDCRSLGSVTKVSHKVQQKLDEQRNDGYRRARQAVLDVQLKQAATPAPRPAVTSPTELSVLDAKQQIFVSFAAPNYKTFKQNLETAPPLTEHMNLELLPPPTPGAKNQPPSQTAKASAASQSFGLKAALNFIVQYFQYRYVSAQDYLDIFTPMAHRDVDLMLASMVDYDWWLAKGTPPATPLETQVEVMMLISVLSDGRVHGFAPFCPLREVAARAGFTNGQGEVAKSSLAFVQDAVRNKGCVGVKLYPPMGFAAYGNSALDDPAKGGNASFWSGGLLPDWTSRSIKFPDGTTAPLGQRLDQALDDLYEWCVAEQVPILAHTDESNGPTDAYKALAASQYWALALRKYPDLRVNFGHLGNLDAPVTSVALPSTSHEFIILMGAKESPNAYGDAAYSSNLLLNQSGFDERIQTAYQQSLAEHNKLASHLMYGTDWSLLEMVGNNEVYMQRFAQLLSSVSGAACPAHSPEDCFFGWNAVDYLGLRPVTSGQNSRSRLESFYARHCMPEPSWMQKLMTS